MKIINIVKEEIVGLNRSKTALRKFAWLFAVIFWGLAYFFGPENRLLFAGIGAVLALISLVRPAILLYPYLLWMGLSIVIGFFVSKIILSLIFYFLLAPLGFVLKMAKGEILKCRIKKEAVSYWDASKEGYSPADSEQM